MATRFIRVNGRVIPINDTRSGVERAIKSGPGNVALGLGAAVAGGRVAANLHRDAAHYENAYRNFKIARGIELGRRNQTQKVKAAATEFKRLAVKNRLEGMRSHNAGNLARTSGLVVGATLLTAGVHKIIPQEVKQKYPTTSKVVAVGSGLGAAVAVRSAYYSSKNMGNMRKLKAVGLAFRRVLSRGMKM